MNRTLVHVLILAGAGVATYIVSWGLETGESAEHAPVVVTIPARKSDPPNRGPTGRVVMAAAVPTDRTSLARELQRELRRVGCYDGDISGVWTTSTRMAMKSFIDRVNARLPIDAPDEVLLSLLRGHNERACSASCPQGQLATSSGLCTPSPVASRAGCSVRGALSIPYEAIPALSSVSAVASLLPSPQPANRVALAAQREEAAPPTRAERVRALPSTSQPSAPPLPAKAREEAAINADTPQSAPAPTQGVYEGRPRRHAHRARSRPPKFLRSLSSACSAA
jgi:hypothetical protein